jgi:hypothetical protein
MKPFCFGALASGLTQLGLAFASEVAARCRFDSMEQRLRAVPDRPGGQPVYPAVRRNDI